MDWRTKIENKCQTTKIEPEPTTFCIQTQKTVFEFNYQTYSYFPKNKFQKTCLEELVFDWVVVPTGQNIFVWEVFVVKR